MQMGQMRDFMTCAKLPSSAVCMDRRVLSFRAVIIGTVRGQSAVYVVHLMCVFVGWLKEVLLQTPFTTLNRLFETGEIENI
jgi:hypothetical protein